MPHRLSTPTTVMPRAATTTPRRSCLRSDDSNAESSGCDSYPPSLYNDSSDDENDERSPTRQVLWPLKLELDPATRMLLNSGAKTTNIDNKDLLTQPERYDPDLDVTFSDEEEDAAINVLPVPKYLLYLGWGAKIRFHDYMPLESTVYDIEDVKISIKGPIVLAAITDHPAYYFLTQVKEELARLKDIVKSSKPLHPTGFAEVNFDFGLLSAKILHYASHYGRSTSPSWTLAKDVPDAMINAMRNAGDDAALLIHMAQMHIYYQAYIETFWPHLDITTISAAQFQFLSQDANERTTIYTGYVETYGDDLIFAHRIDHAAMDNWERWERDYNAPHDDDGPPCKRRRTGDYEPGDNEPERYSPTSPEYCP